MSLHIVGCNIYLPDESEKDCDEESEGEDDLCLLLPDAAEVGVCLGLPQPQHRVRPEVVTSARVSPAPRPAHSPATQAEAGRVVQHLQRRIIVL